MIGTCPVGDNTAPKLLGSKQQSSNSLQLMELIAYSSALHTAGLSFRAQKSQYKEGYKMFPQIDDIYLSHLTVKR